MSGNAVFFFLVYSVFVLLASLAGGFLPILCRLTHRRIQMASSFVAGVMLGIGLLHLLPHAFAESQGRYEFVALWVVLGFLAMFFLERFFCYHHHDMPETECDEASCHDDPCHNHSHSKSAPTSLHQLSWGGALVGLSVHSILAGVGLAAAIQLGTAEGASDSSFYGLAGFGVFLVIFLHKPFDAMTVATLMRLGNWSPKALHLVNAGFSLMVPLGMGLYFFFDFQEFGGTAFLPAVLAMTSGAFLCIAASDVLPELQFHEHNKILLSVMLLLGVGLALGIAQFEDCGHDHGHAHGEAVPGGHNEAECKHGHGEAVPGVHNEAECTHEHH